MKKVGSVVSRIALASIAMLIVLQPTAASATTLSNGSLSLDSTRTAASGRTYTFTWSNITTSTTKCIKVEFDTAADGSGGKPTGMGIGSAAFDATSTYVPTPGSWSVSNNNGTGVTSITFNAGETPGSATGGTVVLTGVTNPSVADTTFYALFSTYNNTDCSTSPLDSGVVTFSVTAGRLTTSSMSIGDPRPLASNVTYTFTGSGVGLSTIRCIKEVFATTPTGSTVPPDLSTSGATVSGSSNYFPTPGSWTADGASTNGTILITDAGGEIPASASSRTVVLTGISNGSVPEVGYYVRFYSYSDAGCSTGPIDTVTVMFIYENGQQVSVDVDPSLTFTVVQKTAGNCNGVAITQTGAWQTNNLVYMGHPTVVSNTVGAQNLTVSTNALNGFTVFARYDHTLYNQNAPVPSAVTISDVGGTNASPQSGMAAGTEAYGYTTDDSTLGTGSANRFTTGGGDKWAKFTTSNLEVMYNGAPAGNATDVGGGNNNTICLGYQIGISGLTEAGHYTDTVFLTATPIY
jgi:hypothetical protein